MISQKKNMHGPFSIYIIEPNTDLLKVFKNDLLPDLTDSSEFVILNNDADNKKFESVIQLKTTYLDDTNAKTLRNAQAPQNHGHNNSGNDLDQIVRVIRLYNRSKKSLLNSLGNHSKRSDKRQGVTILKEEYAP